MNIDTHQYINKKPVTVRTSLYNILVYLMKYFFRPSIQVNDVNGREKDVGPFV